MLKPEGVVFSGEQLNKLFPFFLHITGGGVIKAAGKSLRKIAGIETPLMFNDVFRIKRPFVEEFAAKHFDQITDQLTDLFKPVMDGFETITKIRQQLKRKALPIIALTASAETKLIDRALKAGANRCLTKPFNPKELQQTLIELLHQNNEPKPNQVQMHVVSSSYTPEMKLKHINLKRIEEASLGKPAFVREMLQICKSEIPQTLQQAQHYFNDANYTHFAKSIHKLKNTLLMIGLDEWSSHLQFMESSALAETQLSMVKLFLDELMVTGQEVVEELEQVIPTV